jgi:hypothetical protein
MKDTNSENDYWNAFQNSLLRDSIFSGSSLDEVKNALKFFFSLSAFDMIFKDQTGGFLCAFSGSNLRIQGCWKRVMKKYRILSNFIEAGQTFFGSDLNKQF